MSVGPDPHPAGRGDTLRGRRRTFWGALRSRLRAVTPRLSRLLGGTVLAALLVAAAGAVYYWWQRSSVYVSTDNVYVVGNVTPVSAEVGGQVVALFADDNMIVQPGDPLLQIDPVPYLIAVDQATADLTQARADAQAAEMTARYTQEDRSSLLKGAQAKVRETEELLRSTKLEVDNKQELLEQDERSLLVGCQSSTDG
jgi:membrane fusion protein (multidrug efflux system)